MPFNDPRFNTLHLDAWGIVLAVTGLVASAVAITWSWQLRRWWHHHPFRRVIHGHLMRAMTAAAILLVVATLSHLLGLTIYALPALGLISLALFIAVIVVWRWLFLPSLLRYERSHPEAAVKRAHLRLSKVPATEIPLFACPAGAFVAYFSFEWHPWNHSFHMGMWILGGLFGYAVGSLVASRTALLPRIEPPAAPSAGRRGRR